jgi:hypothetical protein
MPERATGNFSKAAAMAGFAQAAPGADVVALGFPPD